MRQSFIITLTVTFLLIVTTSNGQNLLPEANDAFTFDYQMPEPITFESLSEAAEWADVVAVAQVVNVDYQKTRELNSQGQAFLTVHVPYKGTDKNDLLIVSAKGFDEHQCYYPDREDEGQRYLVFLKQSTKNNNEYHGFKPYCQLQVLLDDSGKYVLRFPLDAPLSLAQTLVQEISYKDPNAIVDTTEWTSIKREEYQQAFHSIIIEKEDLFQKFFYLKYTQGIPMSEIRPLLNVQRQPKNTSKNL